MDSIGKKIIGKLSFIIHAQCPLLFQTQSFEFKKRKEINFHIKTNK